MQDGMVERVSRAQTSVLAMVDELAIRKAFGYQTQLTFGELCEREVAPTQSQVSALIQRLVQREVVTFLDLREDSYEPEHQMSIVRPLRPRRGSLAERVEALELKLRLAKPPTLAWISKELYHYYLQLLIGELTRIGAHYCQEFRIFLHGREGGFFSGRELRKPITFGQLAGSVRKAVELLNERECGRTERPDALMSITNNVIQLYRTSNINLPRLSAPLFPLSLLSEVFFETYLRMDVWANHTLLPWPLARIERKNGM